MIVGPSGSGKSSLALLLMGYGCGLVADDRTEVTRQGAGLVARCPAAISGMVEARGIGILAADPVPQARVVLIVDLDAPKGERMPERESQDILGVAIVKLGGVAEPVFAAGVMQYLKSGFHELGTP